MTLRFIYTISTDNHLPQANAERIEIIDSQTVVAALYTHNAEITADTTRKIWLLIVMILWVTDSID